MVFVLHMWTFAFKAVKTTQLRVPGKLLEDCVSQLQAE